MQKILHLKKSLFAHILGYSFILNEIQSRLLEGFIKTHLNTAGTKELTNLMEPLQRSMRTKFLNTIFKIVCLEIHFSALIPNSRFYFRTILDFSR